MDKTVADVAAAIAGIHDGAVVMIGGFGGSGIPVELIHALIDQGPRKSSHRDQQQCRQWPCQHCRDDRAGPGLQGRLFVSALVGFLGLHREVFENGDIELELVPQGNPCRADPGRRRRHPGVLYSDQRGDIARGRQTDRANSMAGIYVQERWLQADFALIKAELRRPHGQSDLSSGGAQFQPRHGHGGNTDDRQVSQIVPLGGIEPEQVVTPGIFVDDVVEIADPSRRKISSGAERSIHDNLNDRHYRRQSAFPCPDCLAGGTGYC